MIPRRGSRRRGRFFGRVGRWMGAASLNACLVSAAITLSPLAACGTRGLVLGELPAPDAALSTPDAALSAPAPIEDAGVACSDCALGIALSGVDLTAQQGGTTGTAYTDTCPANEAIIGFQGFVTSPAVGLTLVGGIEAISGVLALDGSPPERDHDGAGRRALPAARLSQDRPPGLRRARRTRSSSGSPGAPAPTSIRSRSSARPGSSRRTAAPRWRSGPRRP